MSTNTFLDRDDMDFIADCLGVTTEVLHQHLSSPEGRKNSDFRWGVLVIPDIIKGDGGIPSIFDGWYQSEQLALEPLNSLQERFPGSQVLLVTRTGSLPPDTKKEPQST